MGDDRNYSVLPEQTAYKISIDDVGTFGLDTTKARPLVFTDDFMCYKLEGEPGEQIDWHTHMPHIDEISICLEGRCRCSLKQEEGEDQVVEISPGEIVYFPGGAEHNLEVVGEETHEAIVIYPTTRVARMEMLEEGFGTYDMESLPVGLWVDRERDEIIEMDDAAVSSK